MLVLCEQKCLARIWKQLWWHSGCRQGMEDCSQWMDQQWQKPSGGHSCWVSDVVHAVDFTQRKGDVSGWTVGPSECRVYAVCLMADAFSYRLEMLTFSVNGKQFYVYCPFAVCSLAYCSCRWSDKVAWHKRIRCQILAAMHHLCHLLRDRFSIYITRTVSILCSSLVVICNIFLV